MFNFLNMLHLKQPHRQGFTAILSDFESAWVFTARFSKQELGINYYLALSFADAIIYADARSGRTFLAHSTPGQPVSRGLRRDCHRSTPLPFSGSTAKQWISKRVGQIEVRLHDADKLEISIALQNQSMATPLLASNHDPLCHEDGPWRRHSFQGGRDS